MSTATLHYIYDPLCGWCYGSAPLVKAAREIGGLRFVLHGGGMMAGAARQLASESLREFIMPHVARITGMTGQPFSPAYTDGLLRDHTAMLDSEPPTAAILAVEAAAGRGADMLVQMQKAHYLEGRALSDRAALAALAEDLGIERAAFDAEFSQGARFGRPGAHGGKPPAAGARGRPGLPDIRTGNPARPRDARHLALAR